MEYDDKFTFRDSGLRFNSFDIFHEMKSKDEFCDVTIKFGNRSVSAHRNVVAAAIPYFRNKLSHEEAENGRNEISISDVDADALESLINFSYTAEIDITTQNVKALLSVACLLEVESVHVACGNFIVERLKPEKVLETRLFAEDINSSSLLESNNRYACKNFDTVSECKALLEANFSFVKELISRNDLQTTREEKVLNFVMKWIRKSPEERQPHLVELLSQVRLGFVSIDYLTDFLKDDLIQSSISCRNILEDARTFLFLPHRRSVISSFETSPRSVVKKTFGLDGHWAPGIYAICSRRETDSWCYIPAQSLQYLDAENQKWDVIDSPCFTRLSCSATLFEVNGKLHLYDLGCLRFCDLSRENPSENFNYVGHRLNAVIVVLGNDVYICGGTPDDPITRKIIRFDLTERDICEKYLPFHRCCYGAVALDDCFYVFGGYGGKQKNECFDTVHKFRPAIIDKWESVASMKLARFSMGCTTLDGKMYACGGRLDGEYKICTTFSEVYDPLRDQWSEISKMNIGRCEFSLVSYEGKLYAIGGKDSDGNVINTVEIYDPVYDEWVYGASPLDPSVQFVSAASIK